MAKSNSILILSGYNYRGVIAFCRFCSEENINFSIVASSENDKILLSEYKCKIISIRKSQNLSIKYIKHVGQLIKEKLGAEQIVILPSTEFLNRFILAHRPELLENNFIIPLCDEPLYRSISDKYSFGNLCQKYDLQIPYEYNSITNVDYPFVIKAKKYFGATRSVNEKPIIINSEAEFKNIENSLDLKSYYFQKFIGGKSIYLLFYISKSGNYSVYSQENLIQQNNGLSIVAAVSSDIHESEISEKYAKMLIEEGFFGLIMIELKKYNENYYMIEANPRLWGPSQLILDSGMDLFYQFANDNNLINSPKKKDYKLGTKYYWSGGIFLDEQNAVANVFHDYSSDKFSKNRSQFEKNDIYKKDDTKLIYESELI